MTNKLKLITTPIGNLKDISQRCRETLEKEMYFLAEDTREFFKLLDLLDISKEGKKVESFNDHDQDRVVELVNQYFSQGNLSVVSDAGSPVLSDPAYPLVKQWLAHGGEVESIPGSSAVTVALEVSGLAPIPFSFHGFLPRKAGAITDYLASLPVKTTHIFFESPHRVVATLDLLSSLFPETDICVVRELTKKFEQHLRFKGNEWNEIKDQLIQKGEFVILFRTDQTSEGGDLSFNSSLKGIEKLAQKYLERPSTKGLAKILSQITGDPLEEVYKKVNFSKNQ